MLTSVDPPLDDAVVLSNQFWSVKSPRSLHDTSSTKDDKGYAGEELLTCARAN